MSLYLFVIVIPIDLPTGRFTGFLILLCDFFYVSIQIYFLPLLSYMKGRPWRHCITQVPFPTVFLLCVANGWHRRWEGRKRARLYYFCSSLCAVSHTFVWITSFPFWITTANVFAVVISIKTNSSSDLLIELCTPGLHYSETWVLLHVSHLLISLQHWLAMWGSGAFLSTSLNTTVALSLLRIVIYIDRGRHKTLVQYPHPEVSTHAIPQFCFWSLRKYKDIVPYKKVRFIFHRLGIHMECCNNPKILIIKSIIKPLKVHFKSELRCSLNFPISPLLFSYSHITLSYLVPLLTLSISSITQDLTWYFSQFLWSPFSFQGSSMKNYQLPNSSTE